MPRISRFFARGKDFVPYTNNDHEVYRHFERFVENETNGGIFLIIATVIAVLLATFCGESYDAFLETEVGLHFGSHEFCMHLSHWINDALMAIFFFVVGLEIKREMLVGHLSSPKKAILPIMGALGGMIMPAILYALCNLGHADSIGGWGIPMATDIAFAIGVLSLLGSRVPIGLKVFLTALAVVDDLGAIIVLAIFYPSGELHLQYLIVVGVIMALLAIYNKVFYYGRHSKTMLPYVVAGILMWVFTYMSGIHATIAGVLLAICIPHRTKVADNYFTTKIKLMINRFKNVSDNSGDMLTNNEEQQVIHILHKEVTRFDPMLHRFESALHPFSTFIIMPIFALANANVAFNFSAFSGGLPPVFLGIFCGLFIGKPLGIFFLSWLSVKLHISDMPQGCNWKQFFAVAMLGGIGFTMSIFVNSLAFSGDAALTDMGKISILLTSIFVAVAGYVVVSCVCKKK